MVELVRGHKQLSYMNLLKKIGDFATTWPAENHHLAMTSTQVKNRLSS